MRTSGYATGSAARSIVFSILCIFGLTVLGCGGDDAVPDDAGDTSVDDARGDVGPRPDTGDATGPDTTPPDPCLGVTSCAAAGTRCDGLTLVTCAPNADGCLVTQRTDCALNSELVCITAASGTSLCARASDPCAGLDHACDTPSRDCDGDTLQVCAPNANGCLVLTETACDATPGSTCDGDGDPARCVPGACADPPACAPDARTCDGDTLTLCTLDALGCPQLEAIDCADEGGACIIEDGEAACVEPVVDPCAALETCREASFCDGSDAVQCEEDADGCLVEVSREACDEADESGVCQEDEESVANCGTVDACPLLTAVLSCGTTRFEGSLEGATRDLGNVPACDQIYRGPEHVFAFTQSYAADVEVRLTWDGIDDLDLYAVSAGGVPCDALGDTFEGVSCLDYSNGVINTETIAFDHVGGDDVYLIVGVFGESPPSADYTLHIACNSTACGDGVVGALQDCDDGNTEDGDGCSSTCEVEPGFVCEGSPSVCREIRCGDGLVEGDEACDDGNDEDGDGCSSLCEPEDGFVCDDASPTVCREILCGDGFVDGDEACDDGNDEDGDGCSSLCEVEEGARCEGEPSVCVVAACGDGSVDPGEECDDGNLIDGDGCSSACEIEFCGDGVVQAPDLPLCDVLVISDSLVNNTVRQNIAEAFDWNVNIVSSEGADGQLPPATDPAQLAAYPVVVVIVSFRPMTAAEVTGLTSYAQSGGTVIITGTDNMNSASRALVNGPFLGLEGISDMTSTRNVTVVADDTIFTEGRAGRIGVGTTFQSPSSDHDRVAVVPDLGVVVVATVENAAGTVSAPKLTIRPVGDGAVVYWNGNGGLLDWGSNHEPTLRLIDNLLSATCAFRVEECDLGDDNSDEPDALCRTDCTLPRCGDGIVDTGEECDDGNTDNFDGCTNACLLPQCGDGVVQPDLGEECDDGNLADGDGCDQDCLVEEGWACEGAAPSVCQIPECGDGRVEGLEACDDGNLVDGDGCSATCEVEDGYVCLNDPDGSVCRVPACGDGYLDEGEACDDGNLVDGDGCSSECAVERCGDGIIQTTDEQTCSLLVLYDGVIPAEERTRFEERLGFEPLWISNEPVDGIRPTERPTTVQAHMNIVLLVTNRSLTEAEERILVAHIERGATVIFTGVDNMLSAGGRGVRMGRVVGLAPGPAIDEGGTARVVDDTHPLVNGPFGHLVEGTTFLGSGLQFTGVTALADTQVIATIDDDTPKITARSLGAGQAIYWNGNYRLRDWGTINERTNTIVANMGFMVCPTFDEECDAGDLNADEPDSICRTNCMLPFCGDGIVDTGEECDDGNAVDNDACTNACTLATCGDGIIQTALGENCDAGEANDPGCSVDCIAQAGFMCPISGGVCVDIAGEGWCVASPDVEHCTEITCGRFELGFGDVCDDPIFIDATLESRIRFAGYFHEESPTRRRPNFSCTASNFHTRYHAITIYNPGAEVVRVDVEGRWSFDGWLSVHDDFDDADPSVGCLAVDDDTTLPPFTDSIAGSAIRGVDVGPGETRTIAAASFDSSPEGNYVIDIITVP